MNIIEFISPYRPILFIWIGQIGQIVIIYFYTGVSSFFKEEEYFNTCASVNDFHNSYA